MLQTAHGSLTVGLDAQPGQTLLIRGGTSSVGMAAAVLAKGRGLTVLSTTRRTERAAALEAIGVDHAIVDDGEIAEQVRDDRARRRRQRARTGRHADAARHAARDARARRRLLRRAFSAATGRSATSIRSSTCPPGVRLTGYGGDAADLPADVLQSFLDDVAAGRLTVPIHRTYPLDEIAAAHADMEAGNAMGKLVVRP